MAKILEFNSKTESEEEMLSVDQWSGGDWEAVFEQAFVPMSKEMNCSPWDCLANFVRGLLKGAPDGKED